MDPARFTRIDETTWRIERNGAMRVPAIIYADEDLIRGMDDKVYDQAANVAALPGIVTASYVMPDAHWGYGFPIGGVAAFDADADGVVSAGGVGFDISCGVRTILTGLKLADIRGVQAALADALYREVPAGVGSKGAITLEEADMDAMLTGGARWAVEQGWGEERDLARIEEGGVDRNARPECVSDRAKERQRRQMGTLGKSSGDFFRMLRSISCSMSRTTPARSNLILSTVSRRSCSCIAREQRAHSAPVIRASPWRFARPVSRCSLAAAWARARISLSAWRGARGNPSLPPATAQAARSRATPRSSNGTAAKSSTIWPRRES